MRDHGLGRRRLLSRTAGLFIVVLLAGGVVAYLVEQQQSGSRIEYGFNDPAGPLSYRLQIGLGAPIRRTLVGWNQVQPHADSWNWVQSDATYAALLKAHLRPLLVALGPPCWTHPDRPCDSVDLGATPPDPAYDAAWSEFIRRLAARYPASAGIEIWNEENLGAAFLPTPDPARYTQLLKEAYRAVKRVNRRMPVISGGLFASSATGSGGTGDVQFLERMYAAGAKGFMDAIAIHLYPVAGDAAGTVRAMERVLDPLRAARDAWGDSRTPIWVSEVGVSTQRTTGAGQAGDLVAIVERLRRDGDVPMVIIHRLIDPPVTATDSYGGAEPGYGVFATGGAPKPAACALSAALHATLRC
jgi:hypothetical protein